MDRSPLRQDCEFRLLNDFQRGFPLTPAPYARMAEALGCTEQDVLDGLRRLQAAGTVSRVGAVLAPLRVGASTLAALAAPADRLEEVAAMVSARRQVNHNYEREHAFNLWFVATAPDGEALDGLLDDIRRQTGCPVISLPLAEQFHIDLGFDLRNPARSEPTSVVLPVTTTTARRLSPTESALMAALEDGLPLESRPYATLGERAGLDEAATLTTLQSWQDEGLVRRFGVVVRHHELGFRANAMAVWDVADSVASDIGVRLAAEPGVNLCYRRRRSDPHWRYNLFCMIHGRERGAVEARIAQINRDLGLDAFPHAVLFSRRRFKQCGARYASVANAPAHG